MFQDLFSDMYQTIEELEKEFYSVNDIDEEISLVEKYLSVKELSQKLTAEINKFELKLQKFEKEHGLTEINFNDDTPPSQEMPKVEPEVPEENIIELDENDFTTFQKGIGFYDLWMYDKANQHLDEILQKYPDFNLARMYSAMAYFKRSRYIDAKRELLTLQKLTDDVDLLGLTYNMLGMIASYNHNDEEAIMLFEKAIKSKQNWHEPKFNLAILYYKNSKIDESLSLFEELYYINPKDWEVLFYLGKIYQRVKQYDLASEFFKQTYSITKKPAIIKQIAQHFESRRQFSHAIYWYKKWLDIDNRNINAMLGIAKNLWLTENKEKGIALVKKILTVESENIGALLLYSWMLTDLQSTQVLNVMNKLTQLAEKDQINNSFIFANLARLFYLNHNEEQANKYCSILSDSPNESVKALGNTVNGLISLDRDEPEKALYYFEQISKHKRNFPYLDFYLGYSNYLLGRLDEAKDLWSNIIT